MESEILCLMWFLLVVLFCFFCLKKMCCKLSFVPIGVFCWNRIELVLRLFLRLDHDRLPFWYPGQVHAIEKGHSSIEDLPHKVWSVQVEFGLSFLRT